MSYITSDERLNWIKLTALVWNCNVVLYYTYVYKCYCTRKQNGKAGYLPWRGMDMMTKNDREVTISCIIKDGFSIRLKLLMLKVVSDSMVFS